MRDNPRTWLQEVRGIEGRLEAAGFALGASGTEGKWYLAVYRQPAA